MSCIVCKRNFMVTPRSSEEKISLFRFPFKNKELFHRWVTSLRLPQGVSITSASRVCALHFEESEIQKVATRHLLRPNAVPTLELYVDDSEEDLGPVYMRHLAKSDVQNYIDPAPRTNTDIAEKQNLKPLYESYFAELDIKKLPTRRKPRASVASIVHTNADHLQVWEGDPVNRRLLLESPVPAHVGSRPDAIPSLAVTNDAGEFRAAYAPYVDTTETQEASTRRRPKPNSIQFLHTNGEDSEPELMYPLQFVESEIQPDSAHHHSGPNSVSADDSEEHEAESLGFRVQSFASGDNIRNEYADGSADPLEVCIKEEPGELMFEDEDFGTTETIIPHEASKRADAKTQTDISLTTSLTTNASDPNSLPSTQEGDSNTVLATVREHKSKQYYLTTCRPQLDDTPDDRREKLGILYPAYVQTIERLDTTEANVSLLESKLATFYEKLAKMQSEEVITPEAYRILTAALPQIPREAARSKRRRKDLESDNQDMTDKFLDPEKV